MAWLKFILLGLVAIVAGRLALAAGEARERREAPEEVAAMLADLPAAAAKLSPHSPVREKIEAGELEAAREMLTFRPLAEAPLPKDFPAFTPVGVIQVKQYPAYRKAEGPGFWKLFQHIQTEQIPMTAPVEMTRPSPESGQSPMAFLYQDTSVGKQGDANGVQVVDAKPALAVSLGMGGRMTNERVADAKRRLEAWLGDQEQYRPASKDPWRLFGYNSPMVPDREKYWEAQMLVEVVEE